MSDFILGPLQEMWLKSLEEHPERQTSDRLGSGTPDNYKACCLGEALICITSHTGGSIKDLFRGRNIYDGDINSYLDQSYSKIGLRDSMGVIKWSDGGVYNGYNGFRTLSEMNDGGKTWTEIAAFIREKPERVFDKSV